MKKIAFTLLGVSTLFLGTLLIQSNRATAQTTARPTATAPIGGVPIGAVMAFGGDFTSVNLEMLDKSGWLPCDGRPLRRLDSQGKPTAYADLFSVIGENFGEGYDRDIDPSKPGGSPGTKQGDFNLPDCRGRFLRGVDAGTGRDPNANARTAMRQGGNTGNNVGSVQPDIYGGHTHPASITGRPFSSAPDASSEWKSGFAPGAAFRDNGASGVSRDAGQLGVSVVATGGDETRPKNIYMNWIIKYR